MKIAIVGATGMVGEVMRKVLENSTLPIKELIPVASEKSVGKPLPFKNKNYTVVDIQTAVDCRPDIALFSAGGDTSLQWAPKFAEVGTVVIDNSSAWRMDPTKKLIVPEINAHLLTKNDKIIANPNCSTIQLVMVLAPLHKKYGIKRVIVSTYQSVTGTGIKAVRQLENESKGIESEKVYPYQIHQNAIPQCDIFLENDYTKEEMKLTNETKKIIGDDTIAVSATAVRIPVMGGHSESVNIEFEKPFDCETIKEILSKTSGVVVQDHPEKLEYPMPYYSKDKNEVFVGRIRKDFTHPNALNLWIVSDNLRKGAATNAVQIATYLVKNKLV